MVIWIKTLFRIDLDFVKLGNYQDISKLYYHNIFNEQCLLIHENNIPASKLKCYLDSDDFWPLWNCQSIKKLD